MVSTLTQRVSFFGFCSRKKKKKMSVDQKKKMARACEDGKVGEVQRLLKEAPSLLNASITFVCVFFFVFVFVFGFVFTNSNLVFVCISLILILFLFFSLFLQEGNTPLYNASLNGRTEVVKILLASNADPNIKNDVSRML